MAALRHQELREAAEKAGLVWGLRLSWLWSLPFVVVPNASQQRLRQAFRLRRLPAEAIRKPLKPSAFSYEGSRQPRRPLLSRRDN